MHPLANHLIQLQELTLIREEQKVTDGTSHLQELDASIGEMTAKLPLPVRTMFEKLHKKNTIVIVPVADGICAGCGMRLPISLAQFVRMAREIHMCPNCTRMLYYPEARVRRLGKAQLRVEERKVGVSRFSSASLMIPNLESEDKEGAIRELAFKMEAEGFVDNAEKMLEEALRREAILSTAVEHGLAFPHVRSVEGGGIALALGISRKGIKFDGPNKALTRIVFFISIPTAASAFYLKLLAGLTQTFMNPEARKTLMAEKEPEKLWRALVKLTKATIK